MAHLYSLSINHYRGIEHLDVAFGNTKFVVIIGRGDSGKTTILKAIAAVLSPNWNLSFSDWDFYKCDTDTPIVIEAVVKDLPEELLKENKYGLCLGLLKPDGTITYDIEDLADDEAEKCEKVITIRLTVNEELIPKWEVISGPTMENVVDMAPGDRAKLKMFQVSDYIDNHFSYSKGSPLYALLRQSLEDKKLPEKKLAGMVRAAYSSIKGDVNFEEFGDVKETILELAKSVGLTITELSTLLEFKENAFTESNITLHSDNIPYKLHGKGSKRLLSIAIQKGLVEEGGIVLIDELEQGMEPDRSRNLARLLKQAKNGQVFVTTHSRAVLAEVSASNLFLIRKDQPAVVTFAGNDDQAILRLKPEAFFAKKILCCEGKTEFGIVRAMDDYLQETRGFGLAVQGIVYLNCKGEGSSFKDAGLLKGKGYEVCIFADADIKEFQKKKDEATAIGVTTVHCDIGKCIENMLFTYLPWEAVCEMMDAAVLFKGEQAVFNNLRYRNMAAIKAVTDEDDRIKVRNELAEMSNKGKWYKDIDAGEAVGKAWFDHIDELADGCGLKKEFNELMTWIGNDID